MDELLHDSTFMAVVVILAFLLGAALYVWWDSR